MTLADPTMEAVDQNIATLRERLDAPLWAELPHQPHANEQDMLRHWVAR